MLNTKSNFHSIFLSLSLCLVAPCNAIAETVSEFLQEFHADPARMMQRLPVAVDIKGRTHSRGYINEDYVEKIISSESARWKGEEAQLNSLFAEDTDSADRVIEPGEIVRSIARMELLHRNQATLAVTPWADSYWPLYSGMIANRYADPRFPNKKSFMANLSYVQRYSARSIYNSGGAAEIDSLSPAEKYDLALGDSDFTLTRFAWGQGEKYFNRDRGVATWMGICHGWAGAAHMGV